MSSVVRGEYSSVSLYNKSRACLAMCIAELYQYEIDYHIYIICSTVTVHVVGKMVLRRELSTQIA